jgi:hypothetical protein
MTTNTKLSAPAHRAAGFYKVLAFAVIAAPAVAAFATSASAEISCPQWSTPVCRHWSLGPPATCTEWACAATKQTDPPKKAAMDPTKPVRPPIVRPPVVTIGPVGTGTSAGTATIYAKQSFSAIGGHGRR